MINSDVVAEMVPLQVMEKVDHVDYLSSHQSTTQRILNVRFKTVMPKNILITSNL